jgi:hypothetical protein
MARGGLRGVAPPGWQSQSHLTWVFHADTQSV